MERFYVHDHSFGAANVNVPCLACGRMARLADALIDPAGPAFRAYYHDDCAPAGQVLACRVDGCRRDHVDIIRGEEVR